MSIIIRIKSQPWYLHHHSFIHSLSLMHTFTQVHFSSGRSQAAKIFKLSDSFLLHCKNKQHSTEKALSWRWWPLVYQPVYPFSIHPPNLHIFFADFFSLAFLEKDLSVCVYLTGVCSCFLCSRVQLQEVLVTRGTTKPRFTEMHRASQKVLILSWMHTAPHRNVDTSAPPPSSGPTPNKHPTLLTKQPAQSHHRPGVFTCTRRHTSDCTTASYRDRKRPHKEKINSINHSTQSFWIIITQLNLLGLTPDLHPFASLPVFSFLMLSE